MMRFRATIGAFALLALLGCKADPSTDESTNIPETPPPPAAGNAFTATVEWDIPQTRENGDNLDLGDIGGYEILYRKIQENSYTSVMVDDQTANKYIIRDLPAGEYEVMVAAYDTDGLFSDYSDPIIASIGI